MFISDVYSLIALAWVANYNKAVDRNWSRGNIDVQTSRLQFLIILLGFIINNNQLCKIITLMDKLPTKVAIATSN